MVQVDLEGLLVRFSVGSSLDSGVMLGFKELRDPARATQGKRGMHGMSVTLAHVVAWTQPESKGFRTVSTSLLKEPCQSSAGPS